MKKKIQLLSLSFILFFFNSYAQKNVNVDNLRFSYNERANPTNPLDPPFFYYASKINLPNSVLNFVDESSLYQKLFIEGQRVTDNPTEKDLIINVSISPVTYQSNEIKEYVNESKDKQGNITRTYSYWLELTYSYSASATVTKGDANVKKYNLASSSNYKFQSPTYSTRKAAVEYWDSNKEILREKFTNERINESLSALTLSLSKEFGFSISKIPGLIKTINEKKHPENDALRAKSEEVKTKMESLDGTQALTEEDFADVIEYFKGIPQIYSDPKLKADVRLRYVAYYNLCRIYMFINQPEKVSEYATLLFENGHDKKDQERLMKDATNLQERLNKAIIKSTQFSTDSYFE